MYQDNQSIDKQSDDFLEFLNKLQVQSDIRNVLSRAVRFMSLDEIMKECKDHIVKIQKMLNESQQKEETQNEEPIKKPVSNCCDNGVNCSCC